MCPDMRGYARIMPARRFWAFSGHIRLFKNFEIPWAETKTTLRNGESSSGKADLKKFSRGGMCNGVAYAQILDGFFF